MGSTASTLPPATADDCIPPKKRGNWHDAQQPESSIPPKKRRTWQDVQQPVQNLDWISAMPDDVLIKILSLMTIREAATTDCLSSKWRHLWENVPYLRLTASALGMQVLAPNYHENLDFWNSEATKFVHKVNELLRHHSGNGVQKFKVRFPLTSAHASDLDRWVAFAAASGAKSFELSLCNRHNDMVTVQHVEPYNFPLKYFADVGHCNLHQLWLSNCSLEMVNSNLNGFSYLDRLVLDSVSVVDAVVLNIMSNCCALNMLGLRKCHQLINVRVYHAQLLRMDVYDCKSLISINIHAEKLKYFSYMGHKVDVEYEYAPVIQRLHAHFIKKNECPLECIGAFPELRTLILQFPSRLQVRRVLQNSKKFSGLKEIVLYILTSWEKSIHSVAYLLKAAPLVETFSLEAYGTLNPLNKLKIKWPKECALGMLHTIRIGGFSGEPELMLLLFFLLKRSPLLKNLLIDPHQRHYQGFDRWKAAKPADDATRCFYARGVAWTHLAPKIPSTVKFRVM
ncbi:unnamed protein product [Urochloa decumbens]|uniref:F-box domain-containing protein n=1 Tax=Urochloa decumbens TaxID=240449 RepID=A0ABC9GCR1_9POAL